MNNLCTHCDTEPVPAHAEQEHVSVCCDCYDLSFGMSLKQLNAERTLKGKPPIDRPWPGRRADGELNLAGRFQYQWWPRIVAWWERR